MSEEKHTHVHVLEDGTVIEHSHDHAHGHHHTNTKAVLNRRLNFFSFPLIKFMLQQISAGFY